MSASQSNKGMQIVNQPEATPIIRVRYIFLLKERNVMNWSNRKEGSSFDGAKKQQAIFRLCVSWDASKARVRTTPAD